LIYKIELIIYFTIIFQKLFLIIKNKTKKNEITLNKIFKYKHS